GKWYWADFTVNGSRYRVPLHTTDEREAKRLEKERIAGASAGLLAPSNQQFVRLAFSEAADRYLADRAAALAPRSLVTERERLKAVRNFFGGTPLARITADSIRQYIAHRKAASLGNRTVNMEVGCLSRVLKRAKRWHLFAEELKPLPERRNV